MAGARECHRSYKSFPGLASYYQHFVPNFAQVAKPLHRLTEVNVDFAWTPECQSAFDMLKSLLSTAPVLSYPDFTAELTRIPVIMESELS